MSRFVDSIIAYRILTMLVTPFKDTEAFRLGIVDDKGKEIKRMSQLNSVDEMNAYTLLHRMIFRIKRIIEKVPLENKKLLSFAAALSLVKEHYELSKEPVDLEVLYLNKLKIANTLTEDINQTNQFFNKKQLIPFKYYTEEVPANNAAATPGIDGFTPETLGIKRRKKKPSILTRMNVNA